MPGFSSRDRLALPGYADRSDSGARSAGACGPNVFVRRREEVLRVRDVGATRGSETTRRRQVPEHVNTRGRTAVRPVAPGRTAVAAAGAQTRMGAVGAGRGRGNHRSGPGPAASARTRAANACGSCRLLSLAFRRLRAQIVVCSGAMSLRRVGSLVPVIATGAGRDWGGSVDQAGR